MRLEALVSRGLSKATADAPAVIGPDATLTYAELDTQAGRIASALREMGVGRGDRVGVLCPKSARAVVAMQGVLRAGAAYVPVDARAPRAAAQRILDDCAVRALVATERTLATVAGASRSEVPSLVVEGAGGTTSWDELGRFPAAPIPHAGTDTDLAYILYTSGSTGAPKGVSISHRAALAFVEWAAAELGSGPTDRFANHAPFHFDLSVLDLYAAFASGGAVVLVPEGAAYSPAELVELVHRERISIWYSVPSALILMIEQGKLLERRPVGLRAVLFAGEPFPVKSLRPLYTTWKGMRLLNLYGPTETNVCTFYEVTSLSEDRLAPVPIGKACCGDRVWAIRPDGGVAGPGEEGELLVEGPTVMDGYWGKPPQAGLPYATGDVVRLLADGNYDFVGRRDHLVKVRGYRVELGAIEAVLMTLVGVREVAVIASGSGLETRLVAFVASDAQLSVLDLKRHCATYLPRHMIIDRAHTVPALPRTENGKVDRKRLALEANEPT